MGEQELAAALGRVPLFSQFSPKDLNRVASSFNARTIPAGQEVVIEGQGGVGFFIIESGQASVTKDGREIRTLGPGDYFGEMALIDRGERSASVVAASELECYGMTAWNFRPIVESDARIAWALLETMVARLREAQASPPAETD